jgi:hypothetical protein
MTDLRKEMIKAMELRDFSPSTKDAYLRSVTGLAGFYVVKAGTKRFVDYRFKRRAQFSRNSACTIQHIIIY